MPNACTSKRSLEDVEDFLYDLQDQPEGYYREYHLRLHYPHLSSAFINRHLGTLMRMDPDQIVKTIGYPDPVAEQAVNHVIAERGF